MKIQHVAWEFAIKNGIKTFDINLNYIKNIVELNGWRLYSYEEGKDIIKRFSFEEAAQNCDGFSCVIKDKDSKAYVIFYKNELSVNNKISVILHEIGHIVLNHSKSSILGKGDTQEETKILEEEADLFYYEVAAPSCILQELGIDTANDIRCNSIIEYNDSLAYIQQIHSQNNSIEKELKKLMLENYKDFIKFYKENELHHTIKRSGSLMKKPIIIFSIISIFIASHMFSQNISNSNKKDYQSNTSELQTHTTTEYLETETITNEIETTTIEIISELTTKEENISSDILQNLVYVTPSGKKFHKADCPYVKSKNNLKELTIENAQNDGFSACSVCDPLD